MIQYLSAKYHNDKGISYNETLTCAHILTSFANIYDKSSWDVKFYDVTTDKATTISMRAPGKHEQFKTLAKYNPAVQCNINVVHALKNMQVTVGELYLLLRYKNVCIFTVVQNRNSI